MQTILQELWRGNIYPAEKCGSENEQIRELEGLVLKNREKLCGLLDQSGKERLERLEDCYSDLQALYGCEAFCVGFCLAVKLFAKAME